MCGVPCPLSKLTEIILTNDLKNVMERKQRELFSKLWDTNLIRAGYLVDREGGECPILFTLDIKFKLIDMTI